MNEDALAAVVAAARLLLASSVRQSPADRLSRWNIAGRICSADAGQARLVARWRSRWTMSGRRRG